MVDNAKNILDKIYEKRTSLAKLVWLHLGESYVHLYKKVICLDDYNICINHRSNTAMGYFVDSSAAGKLIELNSKITFIADWHKNYIEHLKRVKKCGIRGIKVSYMQIKSTT